MSLRKYHFAIHIAMAMALLFASGAQWFILQSVAWTGMLISYSQSTPIVEAVQKTFDGEHPCSLCKHIRSAEKELPSKDQVSQQSQGSIILGVLAPAITLSAPLNATRLLYEGCDMASPSRAEEPISPPPQRVG